VVLGVRSSHPNGPRALTNFGIGALVRAVAFRAVALLVALVGAGGAQIRKSAGNLHPLNLVIMPCGTTEQDRKSGRLCEGRPMRI
jgi:hypothetical protein